LTNIYVCERVIRRCAVVECDSSDVLAFAVASAAMRRRKGLVVVVEVLRRGCGRTSVPCVRQRDIDTFAERNGGQRRRRQRSSRWESSSAHVVHWRRVSSTVLPTSTGNRHGSLMPRLQWVNTDLT